VSLHRLRGSREQGNKGTLVAVRNLFITRLPAETFLKSNQTEFKHIYDTFIREAIANPHISFKLINDDERYWIYIRQIYRTD